jgi:nucleoid-associated protein YgaU
MPNKREYTEMTADAKVGLLLGLVFIAIIAFVINGLPDFVQSGGEKSVVETAVTTQTGGSLVIEPAVVDVARSLQEKRTNVRYVEPPVDTTVLDDYAGPATVPVAPVADNTASETAKTMESKSPETALRLEKPALAPEPIQSPEQSETVVALKPQPAATPGLSHVVEDGESLSGIAKKYYGEQEGNKLATIQMLYEANKNVLDSPDEIKAGDQLVIPKVKFAAAPQQAEQAKKETAGSLMDKFKNVFTSVEKKPEAEVKSTQPADKKAAPRPQTPVADKTSLLKTDKLSPVKKDSLTPVVDKSTLIKTDKSQPVKTAPQASAANKLALPKIDKSQPVKAVNPQPVNGVTEYTIQNGDYLYKIAQKQLGDGNRYPEILKLNSGLSEKERLKVGMKLKVPKK